MFENGLLATSGAPIFQSAKGGVAYFNETNFMDANNQPITDKENPLFDGDYLNIYVGVKGQEGHLGAVMGYYPTSN